MDVLSGNIVFLFKFCLVFTQFICLFSLVVWLGLGNDCSLSSSPEY